MCKISPVSVCGSRTARVGVLQEGGGMFNHFCREAATVAGL